MILKSSDYGNQNDSSISSWWFQVFFYVQPCFLGKWSNLTDIFEMDWNHQPGFHDLRILEQFLWSDLLGVTFFQHVNFSPMNIFGDLKHVMFLATPKRPTNLLRRRQKIDSNDVFWGKSWTPGRNRCVGIPFRVHHCCLHLLADPWFMTKSSTPPN